jgi:hypothetical protein
MQGMGSGNDDCPFQFNFDASTFKPGDIVSYRVPEAFDDTPFVGEILTVEEDHLIIRHYGGLGDDARPMRATREDRPTVTEKEALGK